MSDFTTYTIDTAPAAARPLLEGAKASLGFVPNLFGNLAESPQTLQAYLQLSELFDKTSFNATEQQVVLMTNNLLNGCDYCMAAHSAISQASGVPADVVNALRTNTPIADPRLEALRQFARVVNETRGYPPRAELDAFFAAGFGPQQVIEVILGTAFKVISNYANHITETTLDDAFAPLAWSEDQIAA